MDKEYLSEVLGYDLTGSAKIIYLKLLCLVDEDRFYRTSIVDMGAQASFSEMTARRATRELEREGLIKLHRRNNIVYGYEVL